MRDVYQTIYYFDELSESSQKLALQNYTDINTDFDWWDFIADDYNIDPYKLFFDLANNIVQFAPTTNLYDSGYYIKNNHGDGCESFKISKDFVEAYDHQMGRYNDTADDCEDVDATLADLSDAFYDDIGPEILKSLHQTYTYITSDDAIAETLRANKYEFTIDGKIC